MADPKRREGAFNLPDARRIANAVRRVEGDMPRPEHRPTVQIPTMWVIRATLDEDLLRDSTAEATMRVYDGNDWDASTRTVTIIDDGDIEDGNKIKSGAKLSAYFAGPGVFHWIITDCDNIVSQ